MKTCTTLLATLTLFLALGCSKKEEVAEPEKEGVVAAKPGEVTAPTTPTPADPAAAPAAAPTGDLIGVAQCDDYIAKYSACIDSKAPADQKQALQTSFAQIKDSWKKMAQTPGEKETLAGACQTALDSAKQATAAWGCQF